MIRISGDDLESVLGRQTEADLIDLICTAIQFVSIDKLLEELESSNNIRLTEVP